MKFVSFSCQRNETEFKTNLSSYKSACDAERFSRELLLIQKGHVLITDMIISVPIQMSDFFLVVENQIFILNVF